MLLFSLQLLLSLYSYILKMLLLLKNHDYDRYLNNEKT